MSALAFGGSWTERKLSVVREYLKLYATALKKQPSPEKPFTRIYIDAFAGTGDRKVKRLESQPLLDLPDLDAMAKSSTRLALDVEPAFHRYIFIERVTKRAGELDALKSQYLNRNIDVVNKDANDAIKELCRTTNWRVTRGVVFLDPYGLQVSWDTLIAISQTRAIDVWILFPSGMGLNRLLTKDGNIPQEWQDTLDRALGKTEWRSVFYRNEEVPDLFEGSRRTTVKDAGADKFESFYLNQLRSIFPTVMDPSVHLTNSKEQTMYLLCFASANPSRKVKELAPKLARWAAKV